MMTQHSFLQQQGPLVEQTRSGRRWAAGRTVLAIGALLAMAGVVQSASAQDATVHAKLLGEAAFTVPTVELLAGCGVPDQAAIAIRVLSEIPGATYSEVKPPAPWCVRLSDTQPADPTSTEVVQLDQTDFITNDEGKTLSAVGREGDLGTLDTSAAKAQAVSTGERSTSFWSRFKRSTDAASEASAPSPDDASAVPPPTFTYVATPDLLLLSRPGGIFAFDRHFRRFCPIGIAEPGVAAQRAMYQISDGRVLVVSWSLPARDKPAVQTAVLVVPPSLCLPGA